MTLLELQTNIADFINGDETLAKGGCKAFAEDSMTVETDVATHLQEISGVAIVVVTPEMQSLGGGFCETTLEVDCIEIPAVNRERAGHMTGLAAAQTVAERIHASGLCEATFEAISQTKEAESAPERNHAKNGCGDNGGGIFAHCTTPRI